MKNIILICDLGNKEREKVNVKSTMYFKGAHILKKLCSYTVKEYIFN